MVSSLVFHDHLTVINILGLFITLAGIGFYHFMKLREMKAKSRKAAREIADLNLAAAVNRGGRGQNGTAVRDHRRKRRSGGGQSSEQLETTTRRGGFEEPSDISRADVFGDDVNDDDVGGERGAFLSRVGGGSSFDRPREGVVDSSQELIQGLGAASPPAHRGGP